MDTTSIQTIDCEPDSMKDNHSDNSLDAGKENSAFVIDEFEYNGEPVEEVKTVKVNGYQEEVPDESEERQQWSNPLEFLLSCISMSVGYLQVYEILFSHHYVAFN